MHIPLLQDIILVFGLAVVVLFLCHRLRIPAVVGFLFTGIIIGPFSLGLIHDHANVEILAEIGIVLLLFTIGIEFSIKTLLEIRKAVLVGGSLQVAVTFLVTLFIARRFGLALNTAVFLWFPCGVKQFGHCP